MRWCSKIWHIHCTLKKWKVNCVRKLKCSQKFGYHPFSQWIPPWILDSLIPFSYNPWILNLWIDSKEQLLTMKLWKIKVASTGIVPTSFLQLLPLQGAWEKFPSAILLWLEGWRAWNLQGFPKSGSNATCLENDAIKGKQNRIFLLHSFILLFFYRNGAKHSWHIDS